LWVFLSWVVVLFGAELTAVWQDTRAFRSRIDEQRRGRLDAAALSLKVMVSLGEAYLEGKPLPSVASLAHGLGVPRGVVTDLIKDLARHGLVAKVDVSTIPTYALIRDVDSIRVSDVLDALEGAPSGAANDGVSAVLEELGRARADAEANLTLRQLMAELRERSSGELAKEPRVAAQGLRH
jgi:membrane protein